MARKSTAEQRQAHINKIRGHDPVITQENYRVDLIEYTNYHNRNTDSKVIRKWAVEYATTINKQIGTAVSKATDFELRTIGVLSRAIATDNHLEPEHITTLKFQIHKLYEKYRETVQPQKVVPVVEKAPLPTIHTGNKHIAEVNAAIDDFVTNDTAFSMKGYLVSNNIKPAEAKVIAQSFTNLQRELKEAVDGKDAQLKEGYSHLGKVRLKRFLAFVQQLIVDCAQQVVSAKTVRKPRAKKVKPPSVLVSKMKYLKEFADLKLTSEKPETIIGADTIWLYDTEKRKLSVYVAEKGETLSIKGTTITGFSVAESSQKTLRKPEALVNGNLAKRALATSYKDVNAKAQPVNGRTNDKQIILKVFK